MSRAAATAPASQCRNSAGGSGSIVSGTQPDGHRKRPERAAAGRILFRRQHAAAPAAAARRQMRRTSAAEYGWWSRNAIVSDDRYPARPQIVEETLGRRDPGDGDDDRRTVERQRPGPAGKAGRRPDRASGAEHRHLHPGRHRSRRHRRRRRSRRRQCSVSSGSRSRPAGSVTGFAMSSRPTITRSMSRSSCRCWNPSSSTWTVAPNWCSARRPAR